MTAFEKFQERQLAKMVENYPESLPEELRFLTREQLSMVLAESALMDPMPDAELTPDLVVLRDMQREATRKSYEAFVKSGEILLEFRRRFPDETEFWQKVEELLGKNREDAMLAMEAALES